MKTAILDLTFSKSQLAEVLATDISGAHLVAAHANIQYFQDVTADSGAAEAGLRAGTLLTHVDDKV